MAHKAQALEAPEPVANKKYPVQRRKSDTLEENISQVVSAQLQKANKPTFEHQILYPDKVYDIEKEHGKDFILQERHINIEFVDKETGNEKLIEDDNRSARITKSIENARDLLELELKPKPPKKKRCRNQATESNRFKR
ncbi:MAG: hypothetical protein HC896_01940 [Bacteroidales bacterium]|nr:hypothetical protein [Bacteroidales bacterium]